MPEPAELIVRWQLGLSDAADERALAAALRDPEARRAFVREARIAAALGETAAPTVVTARRRRRRPVARSRAPRLALAAGLILALGLAAWLAFAHAAPYATATVAGGTPQALAPGAEVVAERDTTVELGDGLARLALAPGARLRLPTSDPSRTPVEFALAAGRVAAAVRTRPPGAPLAIATADGRAEVVGTRFVLAAAGAGTRLEVSEGVVRLVPPQGPGGVAVAAGSGGLIVDGLASLLPSPSSADAPPRGRVLWRAPADGGGWNATADADGWRSRPTPGDAWALAEVRTPVEREGWAAPAGARLRFRYHVEGFAAEQRLEVHLKPADESNFATLLAPGSGPGWAVADLPLADFAHKLDPGRHPADGEAIHGAVWLEPRDPAAPAAPAGRFWIRDVVAYLPP